MLNVDSLLLGNTLLYGRLLEVLAGPHLADGAGLLELALEFLECALDVLAFFYLYYNHSFITPFFFFERAKVNNFFYICSLCNTKIMKRPIFITLLLAASLSAAATVPHRSRVPDIPGYKTLKGDFHMHTNFSDGNVWPVTRVDEAHFDGLDFISITDHVETHHQHMVKDFGAKADRNSSYEMAAKQAKKYGILVIHGAELTRGGRTFPGHFNTHFITDGDAVNQVAEAHDGKYGDDEVRQEEAAIIDGLTEAKRQGAFITWNHPDWEQQAPNETKWWPIHTELLNKGLIDGIEIYNSFIGIDPEAFHWAIEKDLAITTGTDAHKPMFQWVDYEKGEYRPMTLVFAKERSLDGIREALDGRRTAALADGCVYGKAEWIKPLLDACIEITNVKFTEKKLTCTVRNNSTIPIHLAKAPGSEMVVYARQVHLNEDEEISFSVNGIDSPKPWNTYEFDVNFYVTNWLTDVDAPLQISYHVSVPAKYRK